MRIITSFGEEVRITVIRIIPKTIPSVEKKILCATFLEAVIQFYKDPKNDIAFNKWRTGKGDHRYG